MTRKSGFTLAEVLITLGIIGVVAAMTIPTLINQTNQADIKAAFKKGLSSLNQAVTMNVALGYDDFSTMGGTYGDDTSLFHILTTRMNIAQTVAGSTTALGTDAFTGANNYTLFFNDGMAISFPSTFGSCTAKATAANSACDIVIDVNGAKGPNKLSKSTSAATTAGLYDQFVLNAYGQQVVPKNNKSQYVLMY